MGMEHLELITLYPGVSWSQVTDEKTFARAFELFGDSEFNMLIGKISRKLFVPSAGLQQKLVPYEAQFTPPVVGLQVRIAFEQSWEQGKMARANQTAEQVRSVIDCLPEVMLEQTQKPRTLYILTASAEAVKMVREIIRDSDKCKD